MPLAKPLTKPKQIKIFVHATDRDRYVSVVKLNAHARSGLCIAGEVFNVKLAISRSLLDLNYFREIGDCEVCNGLECFHFFIIVKVWCEPLKHQTCFFKLPLAVLRFIKTIIAHEVAF